MEKENSTESKKQMTLEESTQKIVEDSKKMTKEEAIEMFKSIGQWHLIKAVDREILC